LTNDSAQTFAGYTSYSRDWIKLKGRLSWKWSENWKQQVEASVRTTEYHDSDQFLANSSDTALTEQQRSTTRVGLKTELSRKITENLDLSLRYKYIDDDANNDNYDFSSQTMSLGVNYLFQ